MSASRTALERAMDEARAYARTATDLWIKSLPELPLTGWCACGSSDVTHVEWGYSRFTGGTFGVEDGQVWWHGYTDGWDDMSEDSQHGFMQCDGCGRTYQCPDQMNWD